MDKTQLKASLQEFEEYAETYLKYLKLAQQIAQDNKAQDDESLKIQATIDAVNENIAELNLYSETILNENESIDREIESLNVKIADINHICSEIARGMKLRASDVSRFSKARNLWYIGEDVTGINWNYSTPEHLVSGYIVNKSTKTMKTFEFDKNHLTMDRIIDEIWNLMESMNSSNWEDVKEEFHSDKIMPNKENEPMNE